MPYVEGACAQCRKLVDVHRHQWELPGSGDKKALQRLLNLRQIECPVCGEALEPEGTRAFEQLALERAGRSFASLVRLHSAPTPRSKVAGLEDSIERNIGDVVAKRARDIAHEARQFSRELRFMFDTDQFGRPLN